MLAVLYHLVYIMLGIEGRALCMRGKQLNYTHAHLQPPVTDITRILKYSCRKKSSHSQALMQKIL